MIQSFASKATEDFFFEEKVARGVAWASVRRIVRRKLQMLHAAHELGDLKSPPGNHLERLKGDLAGFHSVRINDRWRVIFEWPQGASGPSSVDVIDYH